jgi:hypothetical protein
MMRFGGTCTLSWFTPSNAATTALQAQLLEEEVTLLVGLLNGNQDLAQLLR